MKKVPLALLVGGFVLAAGLLVGGRLRREGASAHGPAPRVVSTSPGFPLRVALADGLEVVLESPPRRILPANAATFDLVSALVPPGRVAAVPQAAAGYSRLDELGAAWQALPRFSGYTAEVVLDLRPDLVLVHNWQSPEATALVRGDGIAVLVGPLPQRWSDIVDTLRLLGRVLDAEEQAASVLADLERRRTALETAPYRARDLRALSYSNLGAGGTTAGAGTTTDVLFDLAGLRNAAAEAGLVGHVSIDHERLFALDPDLILVGAVDAAEVPGAGPGPSAAYLLEQPDLAALPAIANRRIVRLPARLFTTASQELLRAAERLSEEVERLFP